MAEGCEHYNDVQVCGGNLGTDKNLVGNNTVWDFQGYGISGNMSRDTGMSSKGRPKRYSEMILLFSRGDMALIAGRLSKTNMTEDITLMCTSATVRIRSKRP